MNRLTRWARRAPSTYTRAAQLAELAALLIWWYTGITWWSTILWTIALIGIWTWDTWLANTRDRVDIVNMIRDQHWPNRFDIHVTVNERLVDNTDQT